MGNRDKGETFLSMLGFTVVFGKMRSFFKQVQKRSVFLGQARLVGFQLLNVFLLKISGFRRGCFGLRGGGRLGRICAVHLVHISTFGDETLQSLP